MRAAARRCPIRPAYVEAAPLVLAADLGGMERAEAAPRPTPHLPREGARRSERKRQPFALRPSPFALQARAPHEEGTPLGTPSPPLLHLRTEAALEHRQPGSPGCLEMDYSAHRVGVGGPVRAVPPGHVHHGLPKRLPAIPVPVQRGQVSGTAHQVTRLGMPAYRPVVWLTPPAGRDPHRSAVEGSNVLQGQDESQSHGTSTTTGAAELVPGKVRDPPSHRGASSRGGGGAVRSVSRSMLRVRASSRPSSRTSR